jgi:hypothetical protein
MNLFKKFGLLIVSFLPGASRFRNFSFHLRNNFHHHQKIDSEFLIKINFKLTVLFLNFGFSNLFISTIFIALYQLY